MASLLNIALFGFSCIVLLTDGISMDAIYFLFTIFLLLVPVLNLAMFFLGAQRKGWFSFNLRGKALENQDAVDEISVSGRILKTAALISNVALLGLSCLAFIDQYPHPKEDGLVVFIILLLLTPVLSLLVILRNGANIIQDDMNP